MEIKLHLIKKVTDMERPSNNKTEDKMVLVSLNEEFEEDKGINIFKVIQANPKHIIMEYNRLYMVKNEHKGYEYNTELTVGETKEITSMWGKNHITWKVTYEGMEESTEFARESNE
jgi:hypothetical protein